MGTRLLLAAVAAELLLLVVLNFLLLLERTGIGVILRLDVWWVWGLAEWVSALGVWLVTTDDRAVHVSRGVRVVRWLARLLPCAYLALRHGFWPLFEIIMPLDDWIDPIWLGLSPWEIHALGVGVVSAAGTVALFAALRWFAPRVPDMRLVRLATTIIVVSVAMDVLEFGQDLWFKATDPDFATWQPTFGLMAVGFVIFLLMLASLCLAVAYFRRLHAGLRTADRLAAALTADRVTPEAASSPDPSDASPAPPT